MKRNRIILFASMMYLIFWTSCELPSSNLKPKYEKRKIVKKIQSQDIEVEWDINRYVYVDSNDIITVKQNNVIDTICAATNVADIKVLNGKRIVICFFGAANLYGSYIDIQDNVFDYTISFDTTYIRKH